MKFGIQFFIVIFFIMPTIVIFSSEKESEKIKKPITVDLTKKEWIIIPGFSSDFTDFDSIQFREYLDQSKIPYKMISEFPVFITDELKKFQLSDSRESSNKIKSATMAIRLDIPPETLENLQNAEYQNSSMYLFFSGIGENYELFWNRSRIHSSIYTDKESSTILKRRSLKGLTIPLNSTLLKEKNILLIHLIGSNSPFSFYHNPEFGFFYRNHYYLSNDDYLLEKLKFFPSEYAIFVFIFAFVFYLALFLANRKEISNLDFSMMILIFTIYALSQNNFLIRWIPKLDTSVLYVLESITVSFVPLFSYRFIKDFFQRKIQRNHFSSYVNYFHWIVGVVAIALPYAFIHYFTALVILYYIPFMFLLGFQIIPAMKKDKIQAILTIVVLSIFLVFLVFHIYDYFIYRSGYNITIASFLGIIIFFAYSYSLKYHFVSEKNVILSSHFQKVNQIYQRFVPRQFLNYLNKKDILEVKLGDQIEREMTVLFSDIRGFTKLSYQLSEEETFNLINGYLSYIVPVIQKHNGFIDKYIGDAVMALFPDNPQNAVNAAIEMHQELEKFNRDTGNHLEIGIGIHTGGLRLGIIGHDERMETTVISDAVNLASKIESLTKTFSARILLSGNTFFELEDPGDYHFRILTRTMVKGNDFPVGILEIFNNDEPDIIEKKLKAKTSFEAGFGHYANREFDKAEEIFEEIKEKFQEDKAVSYFLEKISYYKKNPPSDDWSGIEIVTS